MATISKQRKLWKCQVREIGHPAQSKTFKSKAEAVAWGTDIENQMASCHFATPVVKPTMTVVQLLDRYLQEESVNKASYTSDRSRVKPLNAALGAYRLHTLTAARLAQYKRERLALVGPQSVTHELNLLHHAYVMAVTEWGVSLPGAIPKTTRPRLPRGRDKRVPEKDLHSIVTSTESVELAVIVRLAVETAMRRSELLGMQWEHVDLTRRSVYLPNTKTGVPRTVPLSTRAVEIFNGLGQQEHGPVFRLVASSASQAFKRAVQRSGLRDIRFHDLRHEATSRLFERGLNVIEVARITGHKTLAMLDRYTHLDVGMLVKKLA